MQINPIFQLFLVLLLTIIIELCIAFLFRFKSKDKLSVIVLANFITNPALNILILLMYMLFGLTNEVTIFIIIFLELIVVSVEYYILHYIYGTEYSKSKILIISFTMNASSFIIGLLIFGL
jgi:hypothetical protein